MTNHDESTQRPGRGAIVLHAAILGVGIGVLTWLVATYPENPRWYDRLGVMAWVALVALDLVDLVKVLRRRWAKEPVVSTPPVAYTDQDGDRWDVPPDAYGEAYLANEKMGTFPLEYVERVFGPLTPVQN